MATVIERGIVRGRGGLLVAAAGGEFPTLTSAERMQVMSAAVEAAQGRVPILASAQHTDVREIVALARHADRAGVVAIQVGPAYYYESTEADIIRLFTAVGEAVDNVGIMIYNTWWSQPHMSSELVSRLIKIPNVVGLKWAAPTIQQFNQGLLEFADRLVFVDNMGLLPGSYAFGATAFITHVGNFWPEYVLEVQDALEVADHGKVFELLAGFQHEWRDWIGRVVAETGGEGPFIKAALQICGMPAGPPRPPSGRVIGELYEEGRQLLLKYNVPGVG